jgi:predicted glycosyltransferase
VKRILYYCQSLVGIGHLTSSQRIIEELLQHAEVDLIQGGLDTNSVPDHPRFRRLKLPTLLHDAGSGGFVDPDEERDAGEVWPERARAIESFLRGRYDALVVEFWPFGRRRFKGEIAALFDAVRERSGPLPIFTSVRDVLVPRAIEKERRMVASVKKHIHTVFVRGDPQVIRFDDTFSLAHEIADRLCYTGCIAPPLPALRPPRSNQILVSQGGGNVGRELIDAAIGAAALMPDFTFLLACGSRTSAAEIDALRATVRSANVEIAPFLPDFQQRLMTSALSISMGGDNTLLDVISTRTPALATPYQGNPEQGIRIARFAAKGFVHELRNEDLSAERLRARIGLALASSYPSQAIAVDGARVTSERILATLTPSPACGRGLG